MRWLWAVVRVVAIALFTSGFFLTRVELSSQSECADPLSTPFFSRSESLFAGDGNGEVWWEKGGGERKGEEGEGAHCWGGSRFRKVLFVLVDALRYDFVRSIPWEGEFGEKGGMGDVRWEVGGRMVRNGRVDMNRVGSVGHGEGDGLHWFHNAMQKTRRWLEGGEEGDGSGGVRLYSFAADPPTVTMQRLKGLMSGGLPTFIDVRDNFASPEIAEDNLVVQGVRHGRRQVFLGDDTWLHLFPSHFNVSFPFPSFNVKDLHTVDDGVMQHLGPHVVNHTLGRWEVTVAHLLGVDHAGHRYGPEHPAMRAKLHQMDDLFHSLATLIDNQTLFVTLGDHGMTWDGNHGGATDAERQAALILFAKQPLFQSQILKLANCNSATQKEHEEEAPKTDGKGGDHTAKDSTSEHDHKSDEKDGKGRETTTSSSASFAFTASLDSESAWLSKPMYAMEQVDLVPTLAFLSGLPIPFGSLGLALPDVVFSHKPLQIAKRLAALHDGKGVSGNDGSTVPTCSTLRLSLAADALGRARLNAWQVARFLKAYGARAPSFEPEKRQEMLQQVEELLVEGKKLQGVVEGKKENEGMKVEKEVERVVTGLREFVTQAASLCRASWTQFQLIDMIRGTILVALSALTPFVTLSPTPRFLCTILSLFMVLFSVAWRPSSLTSSIKTLLSFFSIQPPPFLQPILSPSSVQGLHTIFNSHPIQGEDLQLFDLWEGVVGSPIFLFSIFLLFLSTPSATDVKSTTDNEEQDTTTTPTTTPTPTSSPSSSSPSERDGLIVKVWERFGRAESVVWVGMFGSVVVRVGSLVSNSFIEAESSVILALLTLLTLLVGFSALRHGAPLVAIIPALLTSLLGARLGALWADQRSETDATEGFSFFTTLLPVLLLSFTLKYLSTTISTSTSFFSTTSIAANLSLVSWTCATIFWILNSRNLLDSSSTSSPLSPLRLYLPRIAYLCSSIATILFLRSSPLQASASISRDDELRKLQESTVDSKDEGGGKEGGAVMLEPKESGRGGGREALTFLPDASLQRAGEQRLMAFCLAFLASLPLFALLLGPLSPRSLVALCMHLGGFAVLRDATFRFQLHRIILQLSHKSHPPPSTTLPQLPPSSSPPTLSLLSTALFLHLSTWHWFFATGHACRFSALHYASPFVGFDEFDMVRGAVMLSINTFSSHLLVLLLSIPIFLLLSLLLPTWLTSLHNNLTPLHNPPRDISLQQTTHTLTTLILSPRTAELAITMAFTTFARRHLMVWAIFAPKFVFDACATIATDLTLLFLLPTLKP